MLEVAKIFTIGGEIKVKGYTGVVTAFNDEHLFCSIPEIALTPEEIDLGAKAVRDREIEGLKKALHGVRQELDRMINDRHYAEQRQREAREEREWMNGRRERDKYTVMDYGVGVMRPTRGHIPMWHDDGAPKAGKFIDELEFKRPSQKKG